MPIEKENDFICPFCSLHCDDIKVTNKNNNFRVTNISNQKCIQKIEQYNLNKKSIIWPKIKNKKSDFSEVIKKAKNIIKLANEISVLNLGTDMGSIRSMLSFSATHNACFDHINSQLFFNTMNLVQRSGYMSTTLGEVKNRSDVIMIFGNQIIDQHPRIIEKFLLPKNSFAQNVKKRKIYLIGNYSKSILNNLKHDKRIIHINFNIELISLLINSLNDKTYSSSLKIKKNIFEELLSNIEKSKYSVFMWTGSDFKKSDNYQTILQSISNYVLHLNKQSRAACLPIAGSLGDTTSNQVATWLTGYPARIKCSNNFFNHDRFSYNVSRLISESETDLVIYVNNFYREKIEINPKIKNIILGHPQSTFSTTPDIFIPVGIPGLDYQDIMFRTDNVVSLALKHIRDINLPTVKSIFDQLTE